MPIKITQNKIIFNDLTEMTTAPQVQAAFPSGTVTVFQQTTAPTGWTKITTYNNYALRVVNGTVSVYTGGMAFTSAFSSSRVPSGSVSVTVGDHTGQSTNSASTGISLQTQTVSGSYSGSTATQTVSFSGTSGTTSASGTSYASTIDVSGTTADATNGVLSHNHSYSYPSSVNVSTTNITYQSGGTNVQVVTGIAGVNLSSGNTGNTGSGSTHNHTVSFSGGSHTHNFDVPSHSHGFSATNTGSHSHSYSGTFTSTAHTHTVSDPGHNHTIPTLTHFASGSFSGNSMAFNVNYVDVILASKN